MDAQYSREEMKKIAEDVETTKFNLMRVDEKAISEYWAFITWGPSPPPRIYMLSDTS